MATLRTHFHFPQYCCSCSHSPKLLLHSRNPNFAQFSENLLISGKIRVLCSSTTTRVGNGVYSFRCFSKSSSEIESVSMQEEIERPPFDINLAVILAGFAFEAYTSPHENIGKREVDAANCQTVILSESFLREIYDGQLFVKLKKGYNFPAMDPWGTSDPYVVMELDSQIVKSKVKWGTKEPTWNEELTLNIKQPPTKDLQIAAWDANLVAPHKRMGNAGVSLESLCDGNLHEVLVDLEGMGGGGKVQFEVKYKSFERIDEEKSWWRIPIVTEFLRRNGLDSALQLVSGSETVQAREFVQYAFGQLKSLNDAYFPRGGPSDDDKNDKEGFKKSSNATSDADSRQLEGVPERCLNEASSKEDEDMPKIQYDNDTLDTEQSSAIVSQDGEAVQSDKDFWTNFADIVNHNVVQRLGLPAPEQIKWDAFDVLNSIGLQSQSIAEAGYVESGLATPNTDDAITATSASNKNQSSLPDIKKVTQDLVRQTDSILGALMVLNATVTDLTKDGRLLGRSDTKEDAPKELESVAPVHLKVEKSASPVDDGSIEDRKAEEMKALFSTAESAMEAWAMLATSMGHPSFIKSEFEKLCFLDNPTTDTQVAIWRDSARKRLVVAFRGTEQAKWKDLVTDLMLAPAGLNPERIGGDFKQEVQVHTGFLSAYDSVRIRIISIVKAAIGYLDEGGDQLLKWHVYVTGHSLGGALATLLALELSSSQLAKRGAISVTMYNFGSPRVGNRKFADVYNEKVKDSWRVVNHRDIIPTVPRLMGYCHVAQPVYLAAGDLKNTLKNVELVKDGYQGDVIGEATPDVLLTEFSAMNPLGVLDDFSEKFFPSRWMKGEKELIEKILNTEINIFRSIRDGTALMQHMEDFYYVSLLENVRSNYQTVESPESGEDGTVSVNRIQES